MMNHRFSGLLCLLFILLLLLGGSRMPPAAESSAPEDPPKTTVPAATGGPSLPGAVNTVSTLVYDAPYGFRLLDSRTAALIRYEYPNGDYHDSVSHLDIVDLYSGTVISTAQLKDSELLCPQSPGSGLFLIEYYEGSCFYVMDRDLNVLRTISVPNTYGLFTSDLSKYYYETDGILSVLDTATGTASPVPVAAEYRFSSLDAYDSRNNTILGTIRMSSFTYDSASIILNPDTGELSFLSEIYGIMELTASGISYETYESDTMIPSFRYTLPGSETFFEIPAQIFAGDTFLSTAKNCDYFFATTYETDAVASCILYSFGEHIQSYALDLEEFPEGLLSLTQSPDGNLVGMQSYGDGYCFCIICPDQLPFEEVCPPIITDIPLTDPATADKLAARQIPLVPEHLSQVRAQADILEDIYGITILLSNQCETPASFCDYPITTTNQVNPADEPQAITTSLMELETALSMYPAGFFRQFRNEAGEYGLLVMLVEDFESQNGIIGVQYTLNQWYCVAMDVSLTSAAGTYCHEIWHATEAKILNEDYTLIDEDVWNTYNPPGFTYSYEDTFAYLNDTELTYLSSDSGTGSYFVDAYSKTNGKEDRARLMEYVMSNDALASEMMKAPALRRKMQVMADAIRQTFDTTGWENVRWERHLS